MIARCSVLSSLLCLFASLDQSAGTPLRRGLTDAAAPGGICIFYPALTASLPNATEFCSCDDFIKCTMDSNCADAADLSAAAGGTSLQVAAMENAPNITGVQCVEKVEANITLNEAQSHVVVNTCGTYATASMEPICAEFEAVPNMNDPKISSCTSVTYGGKNCTCSACNDGMGLEFDCAEYNENATSNGCQEYTLDDINSLQTLFSGESPAVTDDAPTEHSGESHSQDEGGGEDEGGSEDIVAVTDASASNVQKISMLVATSAVLVATLLL